MEENKRDLTTKQSIEVTTRVKEVGGEGSRILEFIASTETPDRSNDIIDVAGWQLDNWNKNPIFAAFHDYSILPPGKGMSATKDLRTKTLSIRVKFPTIAELCSDPDHPSDAALFSDTVYNMYKNGMLNAVSVGYRPIKYKTRDDDSVSDLPEWMRGIHFLEQELLELSAVLVPCNQEALVTMRGMKSFNPKGIELVEKMIIEKSVIPFKHYPLADEDTEWKASEVIGASEVEDLKIICTWYDEENADVKGSYKLPHHMTKDDGYKTVWNGVRAAMGALLGARGGVKGMSEEDKKKCHAHLSKHYEEFGKEVPELKSYTSVELKEMGYNVKDYDEELEALKEQVKSIQASIDVKAGSKFSKESRETIQKVSEAIKAAHKGLKACQETLEKMISEPDAEAQSSSGTEAQSTETSDGRETLKPNTGDGKSINEMSIDDINSIFKGDK